MMIESKWIDWLRNNSYFGALLLFVIAMPLSKALLSIATVALVVAWLVTPDLRGRINQLRKRKSIWVFCSGLLVVVAGLFYSENIERNLFLLFNIKISLVLLPIVIGTSNPLTPKQLKYLLSAFTLANLVASLISVLILFQIIHYQFADTREISIFISSIRFALLLVMNILLLAYAFAHSLKGLKRWMMVLVSCWFFIFLNLLQALTGLAALVATSLVLFYVYQSFIPAIWRYALPLGLIIIVLLAGWYVKKVSDDFYTIHPVDLHSLETLTANGNPYQHNITDTTRINGYLAAIYICEPELRSQWQKRSSWPIDSLDLNGWIPVKQTLIYYLTSMGLRKDSAGMAQLTDLDIRNIEYGRTNKVLAGIGLYARVYDVIREFDYWIRTGNPGGSITIRLNAIKTSWKIFKRNPWIGTGYGDINDDIQAQYEADGQVFGEDMRQNPHNQFFTVLIGAGILGLIIFLVSIVLPGIIEKKYQSYLFLVAFCVVILSFLSDDTLERMIGAVIMAFFFSLFLYAIPEDEK